MNSSARMFVATACLAILTPPFAFPMPGRIRDKEEKLAARIEREKNPGKKARLQIRLAGLKLRQAGAAYDHQNFSGGEAFLQQYLDQVKGSWATLQGANNAIRKHAGAFTELEIALREDDRLLEDLSRRVAYPESEGIKEIEKESSAVHNQVLEALFPDGFSQKEGSRHSLPPRSSVTPAAGPAKP